MLVYFYKKINKEKKKKLNGKSTENEQERKKYVQIKIRL